MDFFDIRAIEVMNLSADRDVSGEYSDFIRYCRKRKYVYEHASDEQTVINEYEENSKLLYINEPLRVEIYVTFLCNLRCTYCFQNHNFHRNRGVIKPEVIDSMFRAISILNEMRNSKQAPIIKLFGGEPLLKGRSHREAIKKILDLCKKNDYRVKLITNGVQLAYYADLLSKYDLEFIQVTLDGPQKVHDQRRIFANGRGSFEFIAEGIDVALNRGLPVAIRVNVDEDNIEFIPELARLIIQKGWLDKRIAVGISPVDEFGPESEWCIEQVGVNTLKKLLEMKTQHEQTSFMSICCRLAKYFEHIVEKGTLPFPKIKYCSATMGNQISLDLMGNMFACC
ncbi:MAG: radical SAM protein [candidate division Zixibacteria bacterium]|nr:radical SAM protein [candidate division Zixibacteria bacterium]